MAMAASSLYSPVLPHTKFSPILHHTNSRNSIFTLSCSSPKSIPVTEQQVLQAIAVSDGKNLPCVRTYDNDLSQLILVGTVDFQQALSAAAADGGQVASEHLDAGIEAMVVETVFPAPSSNHATVSTRLFLPARKVKEKAIKLRKSFPRDVFSGSGSKNILAMTFRQVVLQQIWSYDLNVFQPGEERKMEDLETPREVLASFTLSSANEYLISVLAEAICMSALQSTQLQFFEQALGGNRTGFFHWFRKPESVQSKDSVVILSKLFDDEIVENARSLLDNYNLMKDGFKPVKSKSVHWWKPSCYEKLEKIGGSDFSAWASEYVPAYRLEIDAKIMGDAKIEGWKKSAENRWEVLLTHSQMVQLAETLDIYYVDPYSLPDKQLSCGVAAKFANVPNIKGDSLPKLLSVTLASGIFLVAISALGQFCLPWLCKERKQSVEHKSLALSEVNVSMHDFLDAKKLEEYCVLAVTKVKNTFGWSDEIKVEDDFGVCIGELPAYLRVEGVETPATTSSENVDADTKVSMQDIASYQVVFSNEGKIVGFQPLSRVAVNHWAANPLAKELYRGKKLSPCIIEPSLKVSLPEKVIVIELLMSINPDAYFALARPFR
ncbi:unnamed protein product [Sphenostylis stenocarpa]|uniref:Uncharacterized protein n=1 Tax=Sphenostylis stenocarpa TaxID=92480 RepID=A0AA86SJ61_9FABA|nr:unnamed protein product [Sphenostylis stenocarpa]